MVGYSVVNLMLPVIVVVWSCIIVMKASFASANAVVVLFWRPLMMQL